MRRGIVPRDVYSSTYGSDEEDLDGEPGLLPDAEGGVDCGSDMLDGGLQDPSVPGEKRRGAVHLYPAGARTRMGRAPAALFGAWRYDHAGAGNEFLGRAGVVRSRARDWGE